MAGAVINVLPRTHFDWTNYNGGSGGNIFPVSDPIDALQFTTATLIVRFHYLNLVDIGTNLTIGVYPDYVDDPGSSGFGVAPIVSVVIKNTAVAPSLFVGGAPIYSQYVTIGLTENYGATGPAVADISVDLCLRNPDDTRTATAFDLETILTRLGLSPARFRQRVLHLFEQLFEPWGLDLASVGFVIEGVASGFSAKALSDKIVAVSPALVGALDRGQMLAAIAHELSHVAQIRLLGWDPAARRATRESQAFGEMVTRSIPVQLRRRDASEIDPVDPRFTLEAISGRMGKIAQGWGSM
jgi:hypothetical protein